MALGSLSLRLLLVTMLVTAPVWCCCVAHAADAQPPHSSPHSPQPASACRSCPDTESRTAPPADPHQPCECDHQAPPILTAAPDQATLKSITQHLPRTDLVALLTWPTPSFSLASPTLVHDGGSPVLPWGRSLLAVRCLLTI